MADEGEGVGLGGRGERGSGEQIKLLIEKSRLNLGKERKKKEEKKRFLSEKHQ